MRTSRKVVFGIVQMILASATMAQSSSPPRDYPIQPVPFDKVRLADEFWAPRIEKNRTVTIPFAFQQNEETGRVKNFQIAAKQLAGAYTNGRPESDIYQGERYNDTDVYKVLEGAAYALAQHPDPELEAYCDRMVDIIAAAQEPDGYLFTARTADPEHPADGTGATRWSELYISHELYDMGHMMEAAVAYTRATGKRKFLDVAIKAGDLIAATFGPEPNKRRGYPGHQEVELGLVKLYRATGKKEYLDTAQYFLDARGRIEGFIKQYPAGSRWSIYNDAEQIQAHKPILEQEEAWGHAVRAAYMFASMADVAALTGSREYVAAIDRLWDNVVNGKIYLTGGIGARHDRERFGAAYELPNLTAYNETCASIGSIFWNQRLFLLHGDAKYIDLLETTLYNGMLAGVSLSGDRFFYPNPLSSDGEYRFNKGSAERAPWFGVACCPGNVARFMASISGYVYAHTADTLYVNLFVAGTGEVDLGGRTVKVTQKTRYPWEGTVNIALEPSSEGRFTVAVRLPGWARGVAFPGELYRSMYAGQLFGTPKIAVNGDSIPVEAEVDARGFARLTREWKSGDTIRLTLPMTVQRIVAREELENDRGRVALMRGPLVYCVEGADQPDGRVLNLMLPNVAELRTPWRADLLGGITALTGEGLVEQGSGTLAPQEITAIPYYAWANRGANEMAVWLPTDAEALARVETRTRLDEH